jgi:hypothetical protein
VVIVTFARQAMAGGWVSLTVTTNEQVPGFPAASLAEQLTVVVPFGKGEPEGGLQVGATLLQLSLAVAV